MIEKKCEAERLLEIDNLHSAQCGPPPSIDAADRYVSYFEGGSGDQWLFIGDHKTGKAVIRGGDADWATEYRVSRERPCPADLVLGEEEKQWIIACFMAMSNARYDAVAADFAAGDMVATLREKLTAKPVDHHGKKGRNGDHGKDERREQ